MFVFVNKKAMSEGGGVIARRSAIAIVKGVILQRMECS